MENNISPRYLMNLINQINSAMSFEFKFDAINYEYYLNRWHEVQEEQYNNWENFRIVRTQIGEIDLISTLHNIDGETLIKIAIDLGIDTPDFIPAVATFKNEIKSDYKTASLTFQKALTQIDSHPDIAVSLANSALESIIKEIFKDERIQTKPKPGKTLYDLTSDLLKELQLFPQSEMPTEIKTIGGSFLSICQHVEKLRSEKTNVHGKTSDEYVIDDPSYTYFIINSVTTIGLFLKSYYILKFPKPELPKVNDEDDNLTF